MSKPDREYRHFLEDIKDSIQKILKYTAEYDFEKFMNDDKTVDAVIRNLEIIGEASNKVPQKIKNQFNEIPWDEMYRMRNKAIHEYFGIDYEIVWDIIENYLPENLKQIEEMLDSV